MKNAKLTKCLFLSISLMIVSSSCSELGEFCKENPDLCRPVPKIISTPLPIAVSPDVPTATPIPDVFISPTPKPFLTDSKTPGTPATSKPGLTSNSGLFSTQLPSWTDKQTISLQGQGVNALKFIAPWQWAKTAANKQLRVTYEGQLARYEIPFFELANPIDYPKREKLRPHYQGKSCNEVAQLIGSRTPTIYGRDAKTDAVLWSLKLPGDICQRHGVPEKKR